MTSLSNLLMRIGIDKFAHLGIGGLISAIVDILLILILPLDNVLSVLLIGFTGDAFGVIAAFIKDYVIDDKSDWKDILWTIGGAIVIHVTICIGILLRTLIF